MKKISNVFSVRLQKMGKCLTVNKEAQNLSVYSILTLGLLIGCGWNLAKGNITLDELWDMYTYLMLKYLYVMDTKVLVAGVVAILWILSDIVFTKPIKWMLSLLKNPDPQFCAQEAQRIYTMYTGASISFVTRAVVASAIFWFFAK